VYTESDTDTKKGQKYSTVNLGIHVGLQSSPLGVEGLRALFLSAGIPVPSCSAMQNAGIYVSKTTVQVNESILSMLTHIMSLLGVSFSEMQYTL
jgi:hypothetical protein